MHLQFWEAHLIKTHLSEAGIKMNFILSSQEVYKKLPKLRYTYQTLETFTQCFFAKSFDLQV